MSLYLFKSNLSVFAVSGDIAGSKIPMYGSEVWTLWGQVGKSQLAPDVLATEKELGYCLLDADEVSVLAEDLHELVAA